MRALLCSNEGLALRDIEKPRRGTGETLIHVSRAGICSTDLEIIKGYVPGFNGVLGHEFIGVIEEADDPSLIGKTATAEINCGCGACDFCRQGLRRHCPSRTVLGIMNRNGCFAEYVSVPRENAVVIPREIPESSALFIEPLAAALEIFEQITLSPEQEVLIIGDGRLAQLIACVFLCKEFPITVVGKHAAKLAHLERRGARTIPLGVFTPSPFDIVIEASGSSTGFNLSIACVKPRGAIVLKSTYAGTFPFNPAAIVVNEVTVTGSRCGRFEEAVRFLLNHHPDLLYMISARYPFAEALKAFEKVNEHETLKVVLEIS